MTDDELLQHIAGTIAAAYPEIAVDLRRIASEHRRVVLALDEIADDARESAEAAERDARPKVRRLGRPKLEVVRNG